jgi:transcriptional regulator with XRE-family HTH domain
MTKQSAGMLVREWRTRRRRSQLALALDVGMSTRHLSFVETGRSRPSPELLLLIAERLDVPLRERNAMLLAAGYAPRYSHASIDAPATSRARAALQRMLDAHNPYPGVVLDRQWNVVLANEGAEALTTMLPPELTSPTFNVYRACLHPDGLAAITLNFQEWAQALLGQLRRALLATGDRDLDDLLSEVCAYPNVAAVLDAPVVAGDEAALLVPLVLDVGGGRQLSMFSTLTSFGTPGDVTLDELAVELFYPADDDTDRLLLGR